MTQNQFDEFVDQTLPCILFHVGYEDIHDETGAKLDEVILVQALAEYLWVLKFKPLQWFVDRFINEISEAATDT